MSTDGRESRRKRKETKKRPRSEPNRIWRMLFCSSSWAPMYPRSRSNMIHSKIPSTNARIVVGPEQNNWMIWWRRGTWWKRWEEKKWENQRVHGKLGGRERESEEWASRVWWEPTSTFNITFPEPRLSLPNKNDVFSKIMYWNFVKSFRSMSKKQLQGHESRVKALLTKIFGRLFLRWCHRSTVEKRFRAWNLKRPKKYFSIEPIRNSSKDLEFRVWAHINQLIRKKCKKRQFSRRKRCSDQCSSAHF